MVNISMKIKELFGKVAVSRTAVFQNLALSGKIKGIIAKKLTEGSNLPKTIIEALKGSKVFKVVRLKDGRIKVWAKKTKGSVVERFLFSGGESPRLIKKTNINHLFATTEIHKAPIEGFKDTGYSVTRRVDRGMQISSIDSFRTARVLKFDKSSEWQDVTEHINLGATKYAGGKFNIGHKNLDIVPVYNDTPSLMSKPVFDAGVYFHTARPLSASEALAAARQHSMPKIDTSKSALFSAPISAYRLPVTISAYQRQLWRI